MTRPPLNQPPRTEPAPTRPLETPPGTSTARWLFSIALLAWWFGGYGLVVYGAIDERGPFAFLTAWQIALFGGANVMVGAGIGAVLIFLVPGRLIRLWRAWRPNSAWAVFLDQNMRAAMRSRRETTALARARWAEMDTAQRSAALGRQRKISFIIAGVLLFATWGVATYVSVTANADAGQKLTQLVVPSTAPIALNGQSDWVHVTGATPRRDAVMERDYTIRGHAYRDYYTPLLPAGWQPDDPVYLLEKDETIPRYHDRADRPDPPGPIEGELSFGGPRPDVAAVFRRNGYAVDQTTAVLTRRSLHGVIPGEDDFTGWFIWFMGGVFAAIFALIGTIAQFRRRKLLRQARA